MRTILPSLAALVLTIFHLPAQSLDSMNSGSGINGTVRDFALQKDGRIIAVGDFTSVGGNTRNRIVRFKVDGSLDSSSSFRVGTGANGPIHCVAVDENDEILVGGDFTSFDGHTVQRLARLQSNGRYDASFVNAGVNGTVLDIAVTPRGGGGFYAVGSFTTLANTSSTTARHVAEFGPEGHFRGALPGSGPNATVHAILAQDAVGFDPIIIGGEFTTVSGQNLSYLAHLDFQLNLLEAPNQLAGPDGPVYALAENEPQAPIDPSYVFVGGSFTTYNGQPRQNLATIVGNPVQMRGELWGFLGASDNLTGTVKSLAHDWRSNLVIVGGDFTVPSSYPTRRNLLQVGPYGGSPYNSFNSLAPNAEVLAVAVQRDQMTLVGGGFTQLGGSIRNRLARSHGPYGSSLPDLPTPIAATAIDTDRIVVEWEPQENIVSYVLHRRVAGGSSSWSIYPLPDPTATTFTDHNLAASTTIFYSLGALNGNGETFDLGTFVVDRTPDTQPAGFPDPAFNSAASHWIEDAAIDSAGRIVCSGRYSDGSSFTQSRIKRLLPDGSEDPTFTPPAYDGAAVTIQPDGKILFGYRRLHPDGSIDPTFAINPPPAGSADGLVTISSIARWETLSDGRILAMGTFTSIGGFNQPRLALLSPHGVVDQTFAPTFDSILRDVELHPDGGIVVAGLFDTVNGGTRKGLVKLTVSGATDSSFEIPDGISLGEVNDVAIQPDGKILAVVYGSFTPAAPDGSSFRVMRFLTDGTPDPDFGTPGFGVPIDNRGTALFVQADGKIVVTGFFNHIDGKYRGGVARLDPDGDLDRSFTGGTGGRTIRLIRARSDGRLLLGGSFIGYDEDARNGLALLQEESITEPALAPTSLTATPSETGILLTWTPAPSQTGSAIERRADGHSDWSEIGRLPAGRTQFTDPDLPAGSSFLYRVRGISGLSDSTTTSPAAQATTLAPFPGWLISHGLDPAIPASDDLDHDDWSLYLEFALLRHPLLSESSPWFDSLDAEALTFPTPREGLIYELRESRDGRSWSTRASFPGSRGGSQTVPFDPAEDGASLLLQLRISTAP